MGALISRIARYLISRWNGLSSWVKKAIEYIAGSAIVEAIMNGYDALVNYLSGFGQSVLEAIARILGL
ncbi:hypothetical protein M3661_27820 [Paenibacillus sp. MER 180]|uniref:Uncharacterized protein n=1 Tax=Paenibacillus suaedae TaxID=3077233 RepID=A0AAJ2JZI6_9BACL|nr:MULTISPECIES: hypothetical protein [unclassified Paenibacillus]MCM3293908.1 hypothetical protein [Paenibacillus sp. MER 180]MDT8978786.1 hypothetical protein [Paenibacillus sp. chi10]OBY80539.1 hypothetical protein BBG47_05845 [Paenibacillus sp. KS1]GAV16078.1 hypothetical protein PBN151_6063 [Paenibacillus sp. NAIST15-1]